MARVLVASDDFNRADAALGGGDGWTQIDPNWGNLAIVSLALPDNVAATFDNPQVRWTGAGSWTSDQYAKHRIVAYSFNNFRIATVLVRASGVDATRSFYAAYLYSDSGTIGAATTKIWKVVAGTGTELSTFAGDGFAINDTVEIEAVGTSIRVLKNGALLRSVTDSSISGASSSAGSGGGGSNYWEGGNITSGGDPILMGQGHI